MELIEDVLKEKEAALAKEQALLEDLKRVLGRMGYELVPARGGKSRRSAATSVSGGSAPAGRGRGRPRKEGSITPLSGEVALG